MLCANATTSPDGAASAGAGAGDAAGTGSAGRPLYSERIAGDDPVGCPSLWTRTAVVALHGTTRAW